MITPTFAAIVSDAGKVQMGEEQRRAMNMWLATMAGKPITITIKQERSTRSSQANRYYWGVVIPIIGEHLGYTNDEMHDALKFKFLRTEADCTPADLPKIRSSAALDVKEFGEYLENIITWAGSEFGVNIPAPNEVAA